MFHVGSAGGDIANNPVILSVDDIDFANGTIFVANGRRDPAQKSRQIRLAKTDRNTASGTVVAHSVFGLI